MRRILLCLCGWVPLWLFAQPVITKNDMPSPGDTIRLKTTSFAPGINYQSTGSNFTWDFSAITGNPAADTFMGLSSTPLLYQIYFGLGANAANLAQNQGDMNFIPGFPMDNIYNFFRSATASYSQLGYGAEIMSIPLPLKFNTPDVWYKFPLSVNSLADSSFPAFSASVPGLGYISIERKRLNHVDGWGTLITPFGTFQTLRLVSQVYEHDSIYIDTLGIGMPVIRNYTEYKWLGNAYGIPLFQVTEEGFITSYRWIDSLSAANTLSVNLSSPATICEGDSVSITASASGGTPPYTFVWSNFTLGQTITVSPSVTTTYNVTVADANLSYTSASVTITVAPKPQAGLTASDTLACSLPVPQTIFLSAGSGFANYQWYNGISGATSYSIQTGPPSPGFVGHQDYWVEVTDSGGCKGTDSVRVFWEICGGIEEENSQLISIMPNPNQGEFVIELFCPSEQKVSITIQNVAAQVVASVYQGVLNPGKHLFGINSAQFELSRGLYFLKIVIGGNVEVEKLIIE